MKVTLSPTQIQFLMMMFSVTDEPEDVVSITPAERATVHALVRRGMLWLLPDPLTDEPDAVVQLTPYGYALRQDHYIPARLTPVLPDRCAIEFTQVTFDIAETEV